MSVDLILSYLEGNGPCAPKTIRAEIGMPMSRLTSSLDLLCKRGAVAKVGKASYDLVPSLRRLTADLRNLKAQQKFVVAIAWGGGATFREFPATAVSQTANWIQKEMKRMQDYDARHENDGARAISVYADVLREGPHVCIVE